MPVRRYVVSGRVQGVGFRWFVVEEARALSLRGQVRNLRDGRVEVVAEGPTPVLDNLERILQRGPPYAQVTDLERSEVLDETSLPSGFHIAR